MSETLEAVEKVIAKTEQLHKAVDEQIADVKGAASNHEEKINKINEDLGAVLKLRDEVTKNAEAYAKLEQMWEEAEAKRRAPGYSMDNQEQAVLDAHMKAFVRYIRTQGTDNDTNNALKKAEQEHWNFRARAAGMETKEVNIGTPSAGGYAVPEVIGRMIEAMELKFSDHRNATYGCKVVQVGTSDYKELVDLRGADGGWVGEQGPRPATNTPVLREVAPTHGELYAYPRSSEWALDDMFFNVGTWLAGSVADVFAVQDAEAVIRGDGTNKPTGMLNTTPTVDDDKPDGAPTRAQDVYQYVASGTNAQIDFDDMINVRQLVNRRYRAGAAWAMNDATQGDIRKIKNGQGDYIWSPSTVVGDPDMILGYPIMTWEQLDDVSVAATQTFPVAFGNFKRGYLITDRVGLRITVDQISEPGFVKWYVRRRQGGRPLNNDAIKFIGVTTI